GPGDGRLVGAAPSGLAGLASARQAHWGTGRGQAGRATCLVACATALVSGVAGCIAIAGWPRVSPAVSAQVAEVACLLSSRGFSLVTGCATGADHAVVVAALAGRVPLASLQVLAAFGPGGEGECQVSAVASVQAIASSGGCVIWWA